MSGAGESMPRQKFRFDTGKTAAEEISLVSMSILVMTIQRTVNFEHLFQYSLS